MTSTCSSAAWSCHPGNGLPAPDTWLPARRAPASASRSDPCAEPHPRSTAEEHQREAECQVLDRCVGNTAVSQEDDPSRTQDGITAISDDAAPGEPAVGDQLEGHDNGVGRPPDP